jgi:hypothetical protein
MGDDGVIRRQADGDIPLNFQFEQPMAQWDYNRVEAWGFSATLYNLPPQPLTVSHVTGAGKDWSASVVAPENTRFDRVETFLRRTATTSLDDPSVLNCESNHFQVDLGNRYVPPARPVGGASFITPDNFPSSVRAIEAPQVRFVAPYQPYKLQTNAFEPESVRLSLLQHRRALKQHRKARHPKAWTASRSTRTASHSVRPQVTHDKLAIGAVQNPNILDGTITTVKIAPAAIDTLAVMDGAVTSAKLADGSVLVLLCPFRISCRSCLSCLLPAFLLPLSPHLQASTP